MDGQGIGFVFTADAPLNGNRAFDGPLQSARTDEEGHHFVADEFVDRALVLWHDLGLEPQVSVNHGDHLLWIAIYAIGGKTADIAEQHCQFPARAPEVDCVAL